MRLGQNACLGNCLDEFDGSGERSRAIMALLFYMQNGAVNTSVCPHYHKEMMGHLTVNGTKVHSMTKEWTNGPLLNKRK
jgi:hypothetical protein